MSIIFMFCLLNEIAWKLCLKLSVKILTTLKLVWWKGKRWWGSFANFYFKFWIEYNFFDSTYTEISYKKFVEEIQIQQKIPKKIVPNFLFNYKIKSTEIIHSQTCYRKWFEGNVFGKHKYENDERDFIPLIIKFVMISQVKNLEKKKKTKQ